MIGAVNGPTHGRAREPVGARRAGVRAVGMGMVVSVVGLGVMGLGVMGVMGGCQADPDFVMTDAFAKDLPLSLANTIEGAEEAQIAARGAVMDAMAVAGAPLGPEDVAQRYEDVRTSMTIAERRVRTARVRFESASGRMESLSMQWRRETRVITDAESRRESERRLAALEDAWEKVVDAADAREEAHQDALRMVNERMLVLRHSRAANSAGGAIAANPAPWPVLKARPIQEAVVREGDGFMRACRDMRTLLPVTDRMRTDRVSAVPSSPVPSSPVPSSPVPSSPVQSSPVPSSADR